MNIILIAGFLGADPEVRYTSNGLKVTNLTVATRVRKNKKDDTIWWRATAWGEQFDSRIAYLKKGSSVIISGDLAKPEIFQGRDGTPRISMSLTVTNIMFSPFGKSERTQESIAVKEESMLVKEESAAVKEEGISSSEEVGLPESEEEYAGFAQGKEEIPDISDREVPF